MTETLPSSFTIWLYDRNLLKQTNEENFFEKIEPVYTIKTTKDLKYF